MLLSARPLWEYAIKKEIEKGNNVLVVAHTNTLRGLMKHIDDIDGESINEHFVFLRMIPLCLLDNILLIIILHDVIRK